MTNAAARNHAQPAPSVVPLDKQRAKRVKSTEALIECFIAKRKANGPAGGTVRGFDGSATLYFYYYRGGAWNCNGIVTIASDRMLNEHWVNCTARAALAAGLSVRIATRRAIAASAERGGELAGDWTAGCLLTYGPAFDRD